MELLLNISGNQGTKKSKGAKEKCKDIEVQMRTGSRDAEYKSVKFFFNDYKPKRCKIVDYNRLIIYEDKHRGNVWKEFCSK